MRLRFDIARFCIQRLRLSFSRLVCGVLFLAGATSIALPSLWAEDRATQGEAKGESLNDGVSTSGAIPPTVANDTAQTAEASPAEIAQWIQGLNDDDFHVREEAEAKLIAAGAITVEAIGEAMLDRRPEVAWRAGEIMEAIAVALDEPTLSAVIQRIEVAAKSRVQLTPLAANLRRIVVVHRHVSAVRSLRERGAEVGEQTSTDEEMFDRGTRSFERLFALAEASGDLTDGETSPPMLIDEMDDETGTTSPPSFLQTAVKFDDGWIGKEEEQWAVRNVIGLYSVSFENVVVKPRVLEILAELRSLRRLDFHQTVVKVETLRAFHARRPEVFMSCVGPAMIGIRHEDSEAGCVIQTIIPGSGAEKANLQPGDRILEIDKQPIHDFRDLTIEIAPKAPGDQVEIVFERKDETKSVTVTLQARP